MHLPPYVDNAHYTKTAPLGPSPASTELPTPAAPFAFRPTRGGNRIPSGSADPHPLDLVSWGQTSPEANVVVAVAGRVVVAIGNPAVVGVVVPTAATFHAVRALWTEPQR